MKYHILTLFPEMIEQGLHTSILGRAINNGYISLETTNIRDFSANKFNRVDDYPYGGGAGMVMKPEPWGEVIDAIAGPATEPQDAATEDAPLFIFPSPAGERFTQATARELATEQHLVFGCGRYEGIDERVFAYAATRGRVRLISLGDYVLNGGEVAALAMIEAIVRLVPGVIGNPDSLVEESYSASTRGMLEYPVYTKPSQWRGLEVPGVLLSGDHGAVDAWRALRSREITAARRPDLLDQESPDRP